MRIKFKLNSYIKTLFSNQRFVASLFFAGAGILFIRTIIMLTDGAINYLIGWVFILLIFEMILDVLWLCCSTSWWILKTKLFRKLTMRLCSAAIILHAFRVLVFVLGRTGPWMNFDVKPDHRIYHTERWGWEGVYLASILSFLGIVGLMVVWKMQRKKRKCEKIYKN